jgi:hypothetical protein
MLYNNINKGNLKEFTGGFEIRKEHRTRNFIYFITLDNGDVLRITPELLENHQFLSNYDELHFTYISTNVYFSSEYIGVEITNTEHNIFFLDKTTTLAEYKGFVYVGASLAILILIISLPVYLHVIPILTKNIKTWQITAKKHRQRKEMRAAQARNKN